jgi:hypothetical protein
VDLTFFAGFARPCGRMGIAGSAGSAGSPQLGNPLCYPEAKRTSGAEMHTGTVLNWRFGSAQNPWKPLEQAALEMKGSERQGPCAFWRCRILPKPSTTLPSPASLAIPRKR